MRRVDPSYREEVQKGGDEGREEKLRPREGAPGREQSRAKTNYRRDSFGWGEIETIKKNRYGVFITDFIRVFSEVALLTMPTMFYLGTTGSGSPDLFNAWVLAYAAMILVGTAIRSGLFHPPWTDAPGWVRLLPGLVVLRFAYFNLALLGAIHGGTAVVRLIGAGAAGWAWALGVGTVTMLAFPRAADEWMARFA